MSEVIVTGNKRGVAVGLEWRPLRDYVPRAPMSAEVRALARDNDADRILVHAVQGEATIRASLGMFVHADPDAPLPNDTHALAALLVHAYPNEANLILAWRLETRTAIIVVQAGMPEIDALKDPLDAVTLVHKARSGQFGASHHRLLTNDLHAFGDGEAITLDALAPFATTATRLTRLPLKVSSMVTVLAMVGLAVGATVGVLHWRAIEHQKLLQRELAANDPVPPYLTMLHERMGRLGFARKDLVANLRALGTYPVWQDGWMLNRIDCIPGQCTSTWARMGGTTSALVAMRPGEQLQAESTDERAVLSWPTPYPFTGLARSADAIPRATAAQQNTLALQTWRNAKLLVSEQADGYKIWPTPATGDPARLPGDIGLVARALEASVPLPLASEVIASAPAAVWWNAFSIVFAPGEPGRMLHVHLKGNTYAR